MATDTASASEERPTFVLPAEGVCVDDVVKDFVRQALQRTNGNQSQAARLLGMTRYALRYKMEKYALVQTNKKPRRRRGVLDG